MNSILFEIQETVMKYAEIMSKVAQVEVEVVDQHLFRVAGTGFFSEHVNQDMSSEAYVYRQVLANGKQMLIYNPGEEAICQNCPRKGDCKESIEISMPIRLGNDIIGIIGLVGSSEAQKARVLENEKMYLELLEQIADFISAKAKVVLETKREKTLFEMLNAVVSYLEQGVLLLGSGDVIINANTAAAKQLSLDNLIGKKAVIMTTGDRLNSQTEYLVEIEGKSYSVMGHLYHLEGDLVRFSRVLIFESSKIVRQKHYELTNVISPMGASDIIGGSIQTLNLKKEIQKVAKSKSTVLITGESGTGKELVATSIWKASERKNRNFVAINCGAIPEPLLESELFGYVKGAFTGADPNGRMGKFELANKGVIFLDEIGDMPLYLQVKLLRVLQERKITRIGSNQVMPIDVRIIAATNKNLKEMIDKKEFREDLYYRLNVIPIKIAPLRQRKEDIRELVNLFSNRYAKLFEKKLVSISEHAMNCLENYPWPGNVRELENSVEFMINMMEANGILDIQTLPVSILEYNKLPQIKKEIRTTAADIVCLKDLERQEIYKALELFGQDTDGKKVAAKALGISLATLYRKLDSFSQNEKN